MVGQELRQGRVLSPPLFYIFAAVLTTVLAELVHLKEPPTSKGPQPDVHHVRVAVWGMLYADDAHIVSQSPRVLAKVMEVILEVCRAFGLTVS